MKVAIAVFAACALAGGPASAQSGTGGFANATFSAATIEDGTSPSIGTGIGYRFGRGIAVGVELTVVPTLKPEVPGAIAYPTPLSDSAVYSSTLSPIGSFELLPPPIVTIKRDGGHATFFMVQFRLDVPTGSSRFVPYLIAGGGSATITERYRQSYFPSACPLNALCPLIAQDLNRTYANTTSDFAMTIGGGVSRLIGAHLSLDGDARYIGVTGYRDLHIGRFGGGVTYRF